MSVDQVRNALDNLRFIMDNRATMSLMKKVALMLGIKKKKPEPTTEPRVDPAADATSEFPTDTMEEFPSDSDDGWG